MIRRINGRIYLPPLSDQSRQVITTYIPENRSDLDPSYGLVIAMALGLVLWTVIILVWRLF